MNDGSNQRLHRMLHHAIIQPAQQLVERCRENILVSRRGSDVTIAAGKLCNACHHFSETVAPINEELAIKIADWDRFNIIRDISDTHKHGTLRKSERQIDLTANLTFTIVEPDISGLAHTLFGFRQTEIRAASVLFPDVDVIPLIYDFAAHCGNLMGESIVMPNLGGRSIMTNQPVLRIDAETVSFEDFEIAFYRHRPNASSTRTNSGAVPIQVVNLAGLSIGQITQSQ